MKSRQEVIRIGPSWLQSTLHNTAVKVAPLQQLLLGLLGLRIVVPDAAGRQGGRALQGRAAAHAPPLLQSP